MIDNNIGYYLMDDIIDSNAEKCVEILGNNITLDCQNHIVDGTNTFEKYGIYMLRSNQIGTNTTIKNCIVRE